MAAKDFSMCYGCGDRNPIGLRLDVHQDGDADVAEFVPGENHQGWPTMLHGGLISALFDEVIGYTAWRLTGATVTARLNVEFVSPAWLHQRLTIRSQPERVTRRTLEVRGVIRGEDGTEVARARATLLVLSESQKRKLGLVMDNKGSEGAEKSATD